MSQKKLNYSFYAKNEISKESLYDISKGEECIQKQLTTTFQISKRRNTRLGIFKMHT